MFPHFSKRAKGGEDAASVNDRLLAVADGVGGWADSGVDPAVYSRKLCALIDEYWQTQDDRYLSSPKELLIDAVKANNEIGSCTICIVSIDEKSPVIFTTNLGDSGYMILRTDRTYKDDELVIFYETKE
jgi:protein phosphatase PTC7